jgi:hypothetical protein
MRDILKSCFRFGYRTAVYFINMLFHFGIATWTCLALWYDSGLTSPWPGILALSALTVILSVLIFIRPYYRALLSVLLVFALVLGWWLQIKPSNFRDWAPEVAELPSADIQGDIVRIRNVRNFDYRSETDFTERWEERTYDLTKLRGVDLILSYWGPRWMTHTILSWEFEDGQNLAISIETRKEKGETYSAILGFFRQFELYYVVADERDVIRLRSNFRGEDVYLYRGSYPLQHARDLLLSYLKAVNKVAFRPQWYNALSTNCTTTIRQRAFDVGEAKSWDWRLIANGYVDELQYERGYINSSLPFEDVRKLAFINKRAKAAGGSPNFSELIRKENP